MKITKLIQTSILAGAMASSAVNADMIYGIYIGASAWQTETSGYFSDSDVNDIDDVDFSFDNELATSLYVAIEHPIPLIPNVKARRNDITIAGNLELSGIDFPFPFGNTQTWNSETINSNIDFSSTDFIIYYEIFDNDLLSFDIGLNGKHLDGEIILEDTVDTTYSDKENFEAIIPMAYAAAEIGLPFTGLSIFADASYIGYDGHSLSDFQAGIEYEIIDLIAADISVHAGYRTFSFELDDLDDINADLEVSGFFAGMQVHF